MEKDEIGNIKRIKLINKYSTINSKVYLIKYKINNETILCLEKEIKINNNIDNLKDKLDKEIKLINSLPSNYFLKIYEYYEYPKNILHIITENYISDLSELIKQQINKKNYFSENIIIKMFNKIFLGIKYLHDLNILHRNINPSSIVITSNKIIKISISNFFIRYLYNEEEKSITLINNNYKEYISPEMYMNIPYSFKNDIWSLGILLFHILCLKVPFNIKQLNEIYITKKINSNILYHKIPKHYTNNIKYLCINLLKAYPADRPDINTILNNYKIFHINYNNNNNILNNINNISEENKYNFKSICTQYIQFGKDRKIIINKIKEINKNKDLKIPIYDNIKDKIKDPYNIINKQFNQTNNINTNFNFININKIKNNDTNNISNIKKTNNS